MRVRNSIVDMAGLVAVLQWTWMLTAFGYSKWGIFGGIGGLLSAAPLFPFAPFTAWMFFPRAQAYWFYGLLGVGLLAAVYTALTKTRIVDEFGREV